MKSARKKTAAKLDRLVGSGLTPDEMACSYAVAPFDKLAATMDRKWGADRLAQLVPDEMAMRFGSAMGKLNAALAAGDPTEVLKRAQVCQRGLAAMNVKAEELNAEKASTEIWEVQHEGITFGIMRDGDCWHEARDARPDLQLVTLGEVAVALTERHNRVIGKSERDESFARAVGDKFPGAKVVSFRPSDDPFSDEISF